MKKLNRIYQGSEKHWVGNGFPVQSVFSYDSMGKELDPFLLLDYASPYNFSPGIEKRGVGAHPHRGFETVTITYQGEIEHRDSSGGGGKIGSGDVQWMTAASGLLHDEFHSSDFTKSGGVFEMAQLWVNLPAKFKNADPGYQTILAETIPNVTLPEDSGILRVIAGEYQGNKGPAKTFTPINLWDLTLKAGKQITLPIPEGYTTALLVLRGEVVLAEDDLAESGSLILFERLGDSIFFRAENDAKLLLMSGEPINEPIVGSGPFVMNSKAEILQAYQDVREGRMGSL